MDPFLGCDQSSVWTNTNISRVGSVLNYFLFRPHPSVVDPTTRKVRGSNEVRATFSLFFDDSGTVLGTWLADYHSPILCPGERGRVGPAGGCARVKGPIRFRSELCPAPGEDL